jgi:hypothetical protein
MPCLRLLIAVLVVVLVAARARSDDPRSAVVRITSHGCSGTIIESGEGRTLILSCGHAFRGADATRPIVLDVPWPERSAQAIRRARVRLVRVDPALDLSLIEVAEGPYPYVAPVRCEEVRPSRSVVSVGYDEMRWPAASDRATITHGDGRITYTCERPVPGRSGGALIDLELGQLLGVVQGYDRYGRGEGRYVSHRVIIIFLLGQEPLADRSFQWRSIRDDPGPVRVAPLPYDPYYPPARPAPLPYDPYYGAPAPAQPIYQGPCPNGQCPLQPGPTYRR